MAEPTQNTGEQPIDPTTGMPIPPKPANLGTNNIPAGLKPLDLGLQLGPDGKPLLDASGLPILAPPSAAAAPASTRDQIPAVSAGSLTQKGEGKRTSAEGMFTDRQQISPEEQEMMVQAEGGPTGAGAVVVPGQEVDLNAQVPQTEEERAAIMGQLSAEEQAAVAKAGMREQQRIGGGATPNAQSTSEQVRGVANRPMMPPDLNKALKEGTAGAVGRVGKVATGEEQGFIGSITGSTRDEVRVADTILQAAGVPSEMVGRSAADAFKQGGMNPDLADNIGIGISVVASVAYGVATPPGLGAFTPAIAAKTPVTIAERLLSRLEHAAPAAEGRVFTMEQSANVLLRDVKYENVARSLEEGVRQGGATIHPTLGPITLAPDQAAVSVVPSRSVVIEGRDATKQDGLDFVKGNQDLLDEYPALNIGVWKDAETGKTHYDLSIITTPDRAHHLGAINRQKAIFRGDTMDSERVRHVFDSNEGPHGHGYTPAAQMRTQDTAMAKTYDNAPMVDAEAVPAWRELIRYVKSYTETNILPKLQVEYVSGQPYATHMEMNADIAAGRLKVSKDFSEHPVWSQEDNLLFRVWHDYEHHFKGGADFSLDGEWTASKRALESGISARAREALNVEVYGQAAAAIAHAGEFQPQKIFLPSKKYKAQDTIREQLRGLGLQQVTTPHSPIADTLEAAAAMELADVPQGTRVMISPSGFGVIEARQPTVVAPEAAGRKTVMHGTPSAFVKPDFRMGLWVAEQPSTAGVYAKGKASRVATSEDAPNVRPYYIATDAKLASDQEFNALVASGADEGAIMDQLAAKGYDGVLFNDDVSKITGKGTNYWIFNPLVLTEKFTGQTAAIIAMALAGAAASGEDVGEGGALGAAAGAVFTKGKGKGAAKVIASLSRAEELAKSAQGGLRYLARGVDWSKESRNSKPVNALANVGAAMIARGEVTGPEQILAALVGRFGDGVLFHAETIVAKAQSNFEKALMGIDMRPVQDVQNFFRFGDELPDWYASGERINQVFGKDAEMVAGLIASTSAHNQNERSIEAALHVYAAYRSGAFDATDPADFRRWFAAEQKTNQDFALWAMATHAPNIERVLLGQELSGNKVSNYMRAILGDENAVVIDSHMVAALIPVPPKAGEVRTISGEVVPDWVAEAGGATGRDWDKYLKKAVFENDAVYSYFEGVVRKFAEENGVTPRYAQQAIWTGRVHYEGMVSASVTELTTMFEEVAKRRGYDKLFPGMSTDGLTSLGIGAVLMSIAALANGGVTEDHIEAAGAVGILGNKRVMKAVLEAVRKMRQIPGAVKPLGAVDPTKAMDFITSPTPTIQVGDKLLGMDWVGMSKDADHLPHSIKKVQRVFEDAIKADSRGVVSHDMERNMAETMIELGFDPESAVAKWKEGGREVVSTEIMAVAALTKGAYDETRRLAEMAMKYEGDPRGVFALEEFGRALGVFSSLAVTLGGQSEEAGRALGVFRALVPEIPKEALKMGRNLAELEAKGLTPGARAAAAGAPEGAPAALAGADSAQPAAGKQGAQGVPGAPQGAGAVPGQVSPQAPQRAAGAGAPPAGRPAGTGAPKPGFQGPPGPAAVTTAMLQAQQQAQQAAAQYLVTLLQAWNQLPTSKQQGRFITELGKWGLDMIKELFYSSMLFTFPGQLVNLTGSIQAQAGESLSSFVGIGVGQVLTALGRQTQPAALNEITSGTFAGAMNSIGEALYYAGKSFVTGMPESRDIMGASNTKVPRALSGERVQDVMALGGIQIPNAVYHGINVLGMTLGSGARAMMSADEFMKVTAFRGELHRLATVEANRQGLTGQAFTGYVQQWLQAPPSTAVNDAMKYAHYTTYTSPLEGTLAAISKVGKSTLMLPFTPFFDTLVNIMKYDLEWTPLAPLLKKVREDMKTPGPRQDQALAKLGIGSAMMAFAGWIYMNGGIAGPGPRDKKVLRDMKEIEKYQPMSFTKRDADGKRHFFGFNRFDPIAFPFAFAGAYGDIALEALNGRQVSMETLEELALAGVLALGEVAQTRNYVQGFQQTLEIILSDDPKDFNKLAKVGQRIAGQVVPSGVAQINRNVDENVRAVYSALDTIYARLPGMSDRLPVDVNLKGDPKFKTAALGPDFMSPVPYSKAEPSPVLQSWRANGVSITAAPRSLFGPPPPPLIGEENAAHGILMEPLQQQRFEMLAGNHLKVKSSLVMQTIGPLGFTGELPENKMGMWDIQEALLKTKGFTDLEPAMQGKIQRSIVQGFRKAASGQMLREDKPLREKFLGKVIDRAELYGGAKAKAMAEKAIKTMDIDALMESMGEAGF